MMYASIDIGTNTVLLLVAKVKKGKLEVLHEEQRMPRLGRGVDASRNLHPKSVERVIDVLNEYKELLLSRFSELRETIVTATSAVRDANNREQFIREVKRQTDFEIKLLSGLEEAEYTYAGALSMLPDIVQGLVIDIGGGSTEVVLGINRELLDSHSYDIGSVRFTERYLQHDPPLPKEIDACREAVKKAFSERPFDLSGRSEELDLIGVAGTVTSLACMDLSIDIYNSEKVNAAQLGINEINDWIEFISSVPVSDLKQRYPEVMEGRADVFLGGLLILEGFMKYYSISGLTVSTGGIRHGAILKRKKKRDA